MDSPQNSPGEDSSDEIQPTPAEIMKELRTPTLWQTWRDPTWKKYMAKLDLQMQQLLFHHRKMTKRAVVEPELQKAIEDTTQLLLDLKLKHSEKVKQKGFWWSKQSLARSIGTTFADTLALLKEFHSESKAKALLQQMTEDQQNIAAKKAQGAIVAVQSENPPEAGNLITDRTAHPMASGLRFGGNNTIYVNHAPQQFPIPVRLGERWASSSSAESPTAVRSPIDMWEILTVTNALWLLEGVVEWLETVDRHHCVYWLSDGTDIQRALVMLHLAKTWAAYAAPGFTLSFWDQTVRQNIKSALVASMGQDLCGSFDAFDEQWERHRIPKTLGVPFESMEEQVAALLLRAYESIPHIQRKAILIMVDGLECCTSRSVIIRTIHAASDQIKRLKSREVMSRKHWFM